MEQLSCLVVDDERLARHLLEAHIDKVPFLNLLGTCGNAMEAMQFLQEQKVDLLFLDIQMPHLSGLDFLRSYKAPPMTILTTAYSEFALEGFELSVVDYLLKPIEFERFFKAISKATELYRNTQQTNSNALSNLENKSAEKVVASNNEATEEDYFFIKVDYKIVKINTKEVLYIEADQKYIHIYTEGGKYFTLLSLSKILESLPNNRFVRIHRSFVVNIDKVESIEGNMVLLKEKKLPISKGQKEAFMELVKQRMV